MSQATTSKSIVRILTDSQALEYPSPAKSGLVFDVTSTVDETLLSIARHAIGSHRKIDSAEVRGGKLLIKGSQELNGLYPVERSIALQGVTEVKEGGLATFCVIEDRKLV